MDLNLARYVDKWVGLAICLVLFAWERLTRPWHGRDVRSLLSTTPPGLDEPPIEPRRILCLKFYGLGNAIMLIPVLDAIRRRWPGVEIDFLTMPGNVPLLERSGVVTRAFAVDTASPGRFLGTLWAALRTVRARGYDTVVDFEQFVKISSIIGFVSGARERIGFNTDGQRRGFMYTRRVVYTDSDHISAIFARLTHPLGVDGPLPEIRLPLADADRRAARDFLSDAGIAPEHFPLVAIHLGIGMNFYRVPLKRWEPANFAAVADALAERHGAAIVFTGQGVEERELIAEARSRMRHPSVDACDRFDVASLAALVDHCHFVVSNDTSVMHLAALVGTPVVAIFGPTAPLLYGPRGDRNLVFYRDLYCSPCLTNYNLKVSRCLDNVCMRGIRPDEVTAAIEAHYLGPQGTHRAWLEGRARAARAA
jgi:ADP-heptose:LPS heptosyltransferase